MRTNALVDQLFAKVYADPDDVETRLVLGDALLELGNPRGELITLQAARARAGAGHGPSKRERELLKQHRRSLLGRIAPAILESEPFELELGFVARCAYRNHAKGRERIGDPAWSTVRWLDVGHSPSSAVGLLVSAPIRRFLKTAWRLRPADLETIVQTPEMFAWQEVCVHCSSHEPLIRAFEGCTNLPSLERLVLLEREWSTPTPAADFGRLLVSRIAKQLHEVVLVAPGLRLWDDALIECVRLRLQGPRRVILSSKAGTLTQHFGSAGDQLDVRLTVGGGSVLAGALAGLIDRRTRRVVVAGHIQSLGDLKLIRDVAESRGLEIVLQRDE